jgi:hypothetical protein
MSSQQTRLLSSLECGQRNAIGRQSRTTVHIVAILLHRQMDRLPDLARRGTRPWDANGADRRPELAPTGNHFHLNVAALRRADLWRCRFAHTGQHHPNKQSQDDAAGRRSRRGPGCRRCRRRVRHSTDREEPHRAGGYPGGVQHEHRPRVLSDGGLCLCVFLFLVGDGMEGYPEEGAA